MILLILLIVLFLLYRKKENYKNYNVTRYEHENIKKEPYEGYTNANQTIMKTKYQVVPAPIQKAEKYKKYYKPKIYITTLNELKFYNVLLEIAKEKNLILFAQVSLYSIITMNNNLNYKDRQTYFNKISAKSIDFVLVDKNSCKIKLCIELDDNTHTQTKRIERDKFINELFQELEIPLIRYKSQNIYNKNVLENIIREKLQK